MESGNKELFLEVGERDRRFVYIPAVYSLLAGGFSILQQRILLNIIWSIQQKVKETPCSKWHRDVIDCLELENKDVVTIDIPISNLYVHPADYWQLEKAATSLMGRTIKYPKIGYAGKVLRYEKIVLFNNLKVLTMNSGVRRAGILRVFLYSQSLMTLITCKYGFVSCMMNVVRVAKKKRTPRLYSLLSRFEHDGEIAYCELLEYLGITDEYYCESNKGKNPYSSWSKVKKYILEPVKEEMGTLLANGEIDLSFTYSPFYDDKIKKGPPSSVCFDVIRNGMDYVRPKCEEEKRCVYYVEFPDGCAYVGTTAAFERRVADHLFTDRKSEVFRHKRDTKKNPKFLKLTDYISIEESNKLEYEYTIKYASQGEIMLNRRKPGGYGKRKK